MDPNPQQRTERLFTGLILGGILLVVIGAIGYVVTGASPASIIIGTVGVLIAGLTVFAGVFKAANIFRGPERTEPNCRVMARYGVDALQNVVSHDWIGDGRDIRTYVRLYSPTKGAQEFECALPVWLQCGEGMLGQAVTTGHWLSAFYPQTGPISPRSP